MAKAGRPRAFKNAKEVESFENKNDGLYEIKYMSNIYNHDFDKEKDLVYYIINNIDLFAKNILNDEVIFFEIDMPIEKQNRLSPRGRRIDIYIKGRNKTYIIETKNPHFGTENRAAIGQILDYGREISDPKKELIIITTKFDINTAKTIDYYKLPIRYIYLSKRRCLEYEWSY